LAIGSRPGPAPGSRSRNCTAPARSSRWYSGLLISSIRSCSASPPGSVNSDRSSGPYFSVTTRQPAAPNMPASRDAARCGTTRSSDWRLTSTTHSTSPSWPTAGSQMASQHAPSSSSASPSSEICRPAGSPPADPVKCRSTYRRASAPQIGAVAPMPTEPVE
jgi:hypothetical protein